MKKLVFIGLGAFLTSLLLSYTIKLSQPEILTPACYTSCFTADVNSQFKQEAATPSFALLHDDPVAFKLDNPKGKMISFTTADGKEAMAYEIKAKKKSDKYLLVVQEWWGLNDYIKKEAEAYYDDLDGKVNILALDMYDGKVAVTRDSAMKYIQGATTARLEKIVQGAIIYAGTKAKIYTAGWCFGGMWSLQSAILAGKQAKGCVMYYGKPETNIEKLKTLHCDVIGFFGNQDKSPSPEIVDAFVKNMQEAGKTLYVNRYEAGHGFANPSNPNHNKTATEDAHQKAVAYLKERL